MYVIKASTDLIYRIENIIRDARIHDCETGLRALESARSAAEELDQVEGDCQAAIACVLRHLQTASKVYESIGQISLARQIRQVIIRWAMEKSPLVH